MTKLYEREPKLGDRFKLKNGEIVRFAYLIPEELGADQRLIAVNGQGQTEHYTYPSGLYHLGEESDYDIDCYVKEPKTVKVWMNIYSNTNYGHFYATKSDADVYTDPNRIACKEIEITYTDGEGCCD